MKLASDAWCFLNSDVCFLFPYSGNCIAQLIIHYRRGGIWIIGWMIVGVYWSGWVGLCQGEKESWTYWIGLIAIIVHTDLLKVYFDF